MEQGVIEGHWRKTEKGNASKTMFCFMRDQNGFMAHMMYTFKLACGDQYIADLEMK